MPQGASRHSCLYLPRGYRVYPSIRGVIPGGDMKNTIFRYNVYPIHLDIILSDVGRSESSNELQCDPE